MNLIDILALLGVYAIAIFGGIPLVGMFLKAFDLSHAKQGATEGLPGAGRMIGMVERGIILTFVLTGNLASISFVFVAKSMARFKQLEDREFAEYYLIGTLLSIFFAMIVAVIVQAMEIFSFPFT